VSDRPSAANVAPPTIDDIFVESPNGSSTRLVVLIHGTLGSPRSLESVSKVVTEELPDADQLIPKLPIGVLSFDDPVRINAKLVHKITEQYQKRAYQSVILAGHSLGALVARRAYVTACGENPDAPFRPDSPKEIQPWADKVDRIILLAGVNCGWSISPQLAPLTAIFWTLVTWWGRLLWVIRRQKPLIFEFRRGSRFITSLRIHWLSMIRALQNKGNDDKSVGGALVIQLQGTQDDMVSPADAVDPVTGADFVYLNVPKSSHTNLVVMDGSPEGRARAALFARALTERPETLRPDSLPFDDDSITPIPSVTDVIFVIHGIRDFGYWTHKVAAWVKKIGRDATPRREFVSRTSSYGYLTLLPFLLPWVRQAKVEWLMNEYAEALARFPNASYSYIGHSNGTYLLAKALQEYPACHFKRVIFAGSVVRRNYNWMTILQSKRVLEVLNYVASADWVVAFFPKLFETVPIQDLGSAGHRGFVGDGPGLHQVRFVKGSHGAAIQEERWEELANFIVNGVVPLPGGFATRQSTVVWLLGVFPPIVWAALVTIATALGIAFSVSVGGLIPWPISFSIVAAVLYLWIIFRVLTRA
jgi:pimeloyl-ACP methyl ester carboxylesterase